MTFGTKGQPNVRLYSTENGETKMDKSENGYYGLYWLDETGEYHECAFVNDAYRQAHETKLRERGLTPQRTEYDT